MANYQQLKAAIDQVIKANGQKKITGPVLNDTLKAMVNSLGAGYQFRGVATPSTNPGTPDQNVFYIAGQGGTYANFNSIVLHDGVSILKWNGSWSSETILAGDGVFDISAYKATGGTLATFADLSAALDGGNNIPSALRKGGMSVKFVLSSDNKYVQYRLMAKEWSAAVGNWQGVDDFPAKNSNNLLSSKGAYSALAPTYIVEKTRLKSDGTITGSVAGFNTTKYLPVAEGLVIPCAYAQSSNGVAVCFYDENYQFIDGNITIESTQNVTLNSSNIPESAKYFRATVINNATIGEFLQPDVLAANSPQYGDNLKNGDLVYFEDSSIKGAGIKKKTLEATGLVISGYYLKNGNLNSTTVSGFNVTPFIKVNEGIIINCIKVASANGQAVFFYDKDFSYISAITISSNEKVVLNSSNIPSNAKYFRANVLSSDAVTGLNDFNVVNYLVVDGDMMPVPGNIPMFEAARKVADSGIPKNALVTSLSVDIIPGYYLRSIGKLSPTSLSGFNVTPFIRVKNGITFTAMYVSSASGCAVCFYDEFYRFLGQDSNITISEQTVITLSNENIPSGAAYFRANVVNGTIFNNGLPFYPFDMLAPIASAVGMNQNPQIFDKKYCSLGSSTSTMQWHSNAVEALKMDFLKFGIGGAHFYCDDNAAYNLNEVSSDSPDNVIMNQVARLFNYADNNSYQPDIITLLSGLNDCYSDITELTYEDAMAADISSYSTPQLWFGAPSSIKGNSLINLRAVIEFLSNKFPFAQLVIVTYQHVFAQSFYQPSLEHFHNEEKKMAARYSLPVIDFYTECGWNDITAPSFSNDGTHPNSNGNIVLTNFMVTKLKENISLRV